MSVDGQIQNSKSEVGTPDETGKVNIGDSVSENGMFFHGSEQMADIHDGQIDS